MPDLPLALLSTPGTQSTVVGTVALLLAVVGCWKVATLLVRTTGQAMAAFQAGRHDATSAPTDDAE